MLLKRFLQDKFNSIKLSAEERATIMGYNPNAAFGKVYWVDENSGSDNYDGLTPKRPFATIAAAITASNLTCGSYNMNTIYVNAQTYTEDLTTAPQNVNIYGIGGKTRLQGTHVFAANLQQNFHFHNMWFRDVDGINFTISGNSYGYGWHNCTFENAGATGAIKSYLAQDMMIEDCRFLGNPVFTTAIQISGHHYRSIIRNNLIGATTNGILIDAGSVGYGNWIIGNVIGRSMTDPNSSSQMTYGFRESKTDGHSGFTLAGNYIEAADAISFAHTSGTNETDCCIGNHVVQAGTADVEADENT